MGLLAPENCIIFATGPAGGTSVWGGSRYGVFTKSPQTGLYSESYSGGRAPEAIDATGFDAIVIQGQSRRPTVMSISPEGALFHDGSDFWGMETYEAEDEVLARFRRSDDGFKKPGAVVIGPAAENLIRFAEGRKISRKYEFLNEGLLRRGYLIESGGENALFSTTFRDYILRQRQEQSAAGFSLSRWLRRRK